MASNNVHKAIVLYRGSGRWDPGERNLRRRSRRSDLTFPASPARSHNGDCGDPTNNRYSPAFAR